VSAGILAACSVTLLVACGPPAAPAPPPETREYPCILHAPSELSPDFSVRQHIEAKAYGRTGGFDAVLQKKADTLVVVGLAGGVRAFVLKQTDAGGITFDQSFGPKLPFPPRNVVVDIHRAFWKRLPRPNDAPPTTTLTGDLDGEKVLEKWNDGNLVTRVFTRPGEFEGAVRVSYGPGCKAESCTPSSIQIDNEWFRYTITIANTDFTPL
jgi:hypothetical protein